MAVAATLLLATPNVATADPVRLVALGDSLTAGYGLSNGDDAFPQKLEAALKARGHDVLVVDAGVSGDTSTGGLARLDWSVGPDADGVIVELGANDMLRGADPSVTAEAIDQIVARLRKRGLEVLVAGMRAAPNLGQEFGRDFDAIFPDVAERHGALLYPFFLDGVVADPRLNQADGIHPTAEGIDVIVERILPSVEALIERIENAG
ncbi:MAG TPA: arylesterase [Methylomirabilota bacterium]|nr:arylesterase [Methylomirabilota bacterium]